MEKVWEKLKGDGSYGGPNFKAEIQGRIIEERRRHYAIEKMMTNKIDIDWGDAYFETWRRLDQKVMGMTFSKIRWP